MNAKAENIHEMIIIILIFLDSPISKKEIEKIPQRLDYLPNKMVLRRVLHLERESRIHRTLLRLHSVKPRTTQVW